MSKDLISVIIPIYNRENFIKKCIDSVIEQENVNTEIILVDDGSSDNSPQICDEYSSSYDNVKVIHNSNHGLSHARNSGLDISTGEYIFFLDSDDYLSPDSLYSLLTALKENDADYVIGNLYRFSEEGELIEYNPFTEKYHNKLIDEKTAWHMCIDLDTVMFVVAWGKLYKRYIWEKLRFPVGKNSEDCFVLPQILDQTNKIYVLDKPIYNQILSNNSIMRSKPNKSLLDSCEANTVEITYLIQKGYYDVALYRFGQGTRRLIYAKKVLKDIELQNRIQSLYTIFVSLADQLFPHVDLKTKIRFILFKTNLSLYSFIQKQASSHS